MVDGKLEMVGRGGVEVGSGRKGEELRRVLLSSPRTKTRSSTDFD